MAFVPVAYIAYAALAATVVSAYGQVQAGNAQKKAGEFNVAVEEQNAAQARSAASAQANQVDRDNRRKIAEAMAAYGASGVNPNQGSPLDVLSDLATEGELSKRIVIYQGEITARGNEQQGALDLMQGKAAQTAGYINAGATILGGAAKIAGAYSTPTPTASAAAPNFGTSADPWAKYASSSW